MAPPDLPWSGIWITGASSGIGAALARRLDGRGARIAISARSGEKLTSLADAGQDLQAMPLDVTDAGAVKGAAADIEAATGGIDLAVLNAGTWDLGLIEALDAGAFRRGMDVNYMGVLHGIQAVLPGMLARGRGHIAIVSSVAGYRGLPKAGAYGPTKAALINLAETLHCEVSGRGVTVSLINPGFVDTPLTADNPFPMPGLITAEAAALAMEKGLMRGRFEIAFPWGFTRAMKALRVVPNGVFFWLVRRFMFKG